jgi:phosphatidylglycerol:prolipoprotein diacylglycerol transferase
MNNIDFPNLGIHLNNVPNGFTIFGIDIKLYGIVIALGFLVAFWIASNEAKRTGQDPELYLDYLLIGIIPSILGARIYYIIFSLDYYIQPGASFGETLLRMIDIRQGGLAIYGGLIGGILACLIFARKKKVSFFMMMDTLALGIPLAQAMGRWGNFFNREAFGSYTDSLFAMAIPLEYYQNHGSLTALVNEGIITGDMLQNTVDGAIWVHPTFLYESVWNLLLFAFLMVWTRRKRFKGEILSIYVFGYGLGRFFIESLRTDPLMIGTTSIRVSQVLALGLVIGSAVFFLYRNTQYKRYGKYVIEVGKIPTSQEESSDS